MARVVVFGSLNMDLTVNVAALPQRGQTVIGDRLQMFAGGKGANQAVAAARLGATVTMNGRIGNDTLGERLLQDLQAAGVDARGVVRDPEQPTGAALVMVEAMGQNQIAVAPGANYAVGRSDVLLLSRLLDAETWLVLQAEIPVAAVELAIGVAKRRGAKVLFNAAPTMGITPKLLNGVDVLVVNEHEAGDIFGTKVSSLPSARRAALRATQVGVGAAFVTVGSAGAVLVEHGAARDVEPFRVNAIDTTGAGDAFVGALAASLSMGANLQHAGRLASAAGAAATTRHGAQTSLPSLDDLRALFQIEVAS